jgi:hypothetical protein
MLVEFMVVNFFAAYRRFSTQLIGKNQKNSDVAFEWDCPKFIYNFGHQTIQIRFLKL